MKNELTMTVKITVRGATPERAANGVARCIKALKDSGAIRDRDDIEYRLGIGVSYIESSGTVCGECRNKKLLQNWD